MAGGNDRLGLKKGYKGLISVLEGWGLQGLSLEEEG